MSPSKLKRFRCSVIEALRVCISREDHKCVLISFNEGLPDLIWVRLHDENRHGLSTSMDPLENFHLSLESVAGEVPKCAETYDVSADNYEAARDTIYNRFGDVKLAEEHHVDTHSHHRI